MLSFRQGGKAEGDQFEAWYGTISYGRVSIEGEYGSVRESNHRVRLYGGYKDGEIAVGGQRGALLRVKRTLQTNPLGAMMPA